MDLGRTLRSLCADDDAARPGMVLMVSTVDATAVEACGMAVLEHGLPLSATAPMYAASLAKLVTSRCVHLLASEGMLELDESIDRWFPSLDAASSITVRHLLLHRSGLPEYHALRLVAGASVDDRLEQAEVACLVDRMEPWFPAGSRVSYNNTNYAMLAMIVARVTGERFSTAARSLVFEPAGMVDASVREHADALVDGAAHGYVQHPRGFRRAILGLASCGDGGMWWSGNDLAALGRLLAAGDEGVRAMRLQVPLPDGSVPALAAGCTVGTGGHWFGALAEFTGFRAELRVYDGVAIGVMANRQDAPTGARLDELAARLGLPASVLAPPPQRRAGPLPTGVLTAEGGAAWRFAPIAPGAGPVPAAVGSVEVGDLRFHLVDDGVGWSVLERATVSVGWEDDALVVRDGDTEIASLRSVGGEPPTGERLTGAVGWWWCPAAQAVVRVTHTDDGGLLLHRGQRPPEPLQAVGSRDGRCVLAAPWGLVELDVDGPSGQIVMHRAEGLRLERLVEASRPG